MIKKWIARLGGKSTPAVPEQKKPESGRQAEGQVAPAGATPPRQKPRQDHPKKGHAKPQAKAAAPSWDISRFEVPSADGKSRFHDFDLHPELMHAIQEMGFSYCTPIQAMTLPHTLKGLDVIGKAQTGTGKTAAFLITIIDQLLNHPAEGKRYLKEPRALIVAPTRELVQQIAEDAKGLTSCCNLKVLSVVGGESFEKQRQHLDDHPIDILVATPGRLIDFVGRQDIFLDQIEVLVLDEADRMLDMGFIPQVKQIVRHTPRKENRQTLLFSATFTQDIINLSNQWTVDPVKVEIEPEQVATDTVHQIAYMVSDKEKVRVLINLLHQDEVKLAIIFANRRDQAQRLHDRVAKSGLRVGILSGDITQAKRTRTLEDFKNGKIKTLIATDVVGRGIHIEGVTHVINFNLPQEPENYVHRIGRTGRAGASGTAISLIGEEDAYEIPALEKLLGKRLNLQTPPAELTH